MILHAMLYKGNTSCMVSHPCSVWRSVTMFGNLSSVQSETMGKLIELLVVMIDESNTGKLILEYR
jgi:hypothetical protein